MNWLTFVQAISGDSTHIVMIVFMVMSYSRHQARQKALEAHILRLEGIVRAIAQAMPKKSVSVPLPQPPDLE